MDKQENIVQSKQSNLITEKPSTSTSNPISKPPLPTPKWKPNTCRKRKRVTKNPIPPKEKSAESPAIGSRRTSWVWAHFTIYEEDQNPRASCNYCGQVYAAHSKQHGTGEKDNDDDEEVEITDKGKGKEGEISGNGKGKDSKIFGQPEEEDWEVARSFIKNFKLFYDVTLQFSGSLHVTSNLFFLEIVAVQTRMKNLSKHKDAKVFVMAMKIRKFDKYWDSFNKINLLLYVATVLDPRYKLRFVRFCIDQVYENDNKLCGVLEENVKNTLIRLYDCYKQLDPSQDSTFSSSNQTSVDAVNIDENVDTIKFLSSQFEKHLEENENIDTKSELSKYLGENCEKNIDSFDVLRWWKDNSSRYPILSQITRDVLAILVSTVASECAFSTSGRILDPCRSSLNPEMVEALVCYQNWLRSKPVTIDTQESMKEVSIEEVEKYEQIIKEFKTGTTSDEVQVIDN